MDPANPVAAAVPFRGSRLWRALAASLVVIVVFAFILDAGELPVLPERAAMQAETWLAFGGYALSWAAVLYLRFSRWYHLLKVHYPVDRRRVLTASLLGFGALTILPFRMGEFVRPALVRKRGVLSGSEAMGTIAAERIADGLFLSLLVVLALASSPIVSPLPTHVGNIPMPLRLIPVAAYTSAAVFAGLLLATVLFYWNRKRAEALTHRALGWISGGLAAWVARTVGQLATGLGCLRHPKASVPFVLSSAAQWAVAILGVWGLMNALGFEDVSLAHATAIFGILGLGVLTPGAPGHFGTFQLAVYAGLALYYPAIIISSVGTTLVFILYTVQTGLPIVSGMVGLVLQKRFARHQQNQAPEAPPFQGVAEPPRPTQL